MGKHSEHKTAHAWTGSTSGTGSDSYPAGSSVRGKRDMARKSVYVTGFVIALALGALIGFNAKPIAKFASRVYLSLKLSKSHVTGREGKRVQRALSPLPTNPDGSINTLVLGSDAGSNKGEGGYCRSDVMLLVSLQEKKKKAVVISIPRDTMVEIPGYGTQKINAAHAFYGPSGAIDAVKELTGLQVNHYISMQFTGFQQIVNALGGVPIHLNAPINDPHSGYLPAGDLNLDGWQALVLVRSRNLPMGDLDRIESQHAFLKALLDKASAVKSLRKANEMVNILASNCKMDYSAGQLMDLAESLRGFKPENVQFVTAPGQFATVDSLDYWIVDANLMSQVANEVRTSAWISPELSAKLQSDSSARAEVLNAPNSDVITVLSGTEASASEVPMLASELTLMGHKGVYQGHAKEPLAQTTIYYRKEAKTYFNAMMTSIPELSGAAVLENEQVPASYNSPIVVVLGRGFVTPPIVSIYGRIATPVFNFEGFGIRRLTFKR
ncbi:MAG TPA: LCP family protein [Candidatus Anoxymicrobiaceae bacterium]